MLWAVPWMEFVITVCQGCGSRRRSRSGPRRSPGLSELRPCSRQTARSQDHAAKPPLRRAQPLGVGSSLLVIAVVVVVLLTA